MKWPKLLTNVTDLFKKKKVHMSNIDKIVNKVDRKRVPSKMGIPSNTPMSVIKAETTTHKFTEEQRKDIIRLIARGITYREVQEEVMSLTGHFISDAQILQYKKSKKWKPVLQKERELYLKALEDVPGYHKKVRLERADKIYNVAMQSGELKNALIATEHQRREVEEKDSQPVSFVFQQYNGLSNEELEDKYSQALQKIEDHKRKQAITIQGDTNGSSTV